MEILIKKVLKNKCREYKQMASIIDNRNKTMLASLRNSLKQAESVPIIYAVLCFKSFIIGLFSGFHLNSINDILFAGLF